MIRFLTGTFIILHGLVHLWYFSLSQGLVPIEPEMGWTGSSWLFAPLLGSAAARTLAGPLYLVATLAFVVAGAGFFTQAAWARPALAVAALLSSALILLFWNSGLNMWMEKGLIGLLINLALLAVLWLGHSPSLAF